LLVFSIYAETYNAILFSWDGAGRERVEELLTNEKLPTVKLLKEQGAFVKIKVEGHPTTTAPGHAEMLTGLPSNITKVKSNERWEPIPEGLTIFERLENYFGKDNIVTVAIMGKSGYLGAKGPEELKDTKYPKYLKKGEPYFNAKKHLDVWDGDMIRDAVTVAEKAIVYIEKYKENRFFIFCHFSDPDSTGHNYGENSEEYKESIIRCDSLVGKVIWKLNELKIYDKTFIYITADHGFNKDTNNHPNAPDVFLVTNDKEVKRDGTQADITPTILKRFKVDLSKLTPTLPGKALQE